MNHSHRLCTVSVSMRPSVLRLCLATLKSLAQLGALSAAANVVLSPTALPFIFFLF